jgi:hypothetical protein
MGTGFITNLFWGLTVEEFIYDSMKWIVIGGLGFTASEQFSKTKNDRIIILNKTLTTKNL